MSTTTHIDTSLIRLRQARSQAYWVVDHRWPHEVSRAVDAINEDWSQQIDAIVEEERDQNDEKIRKIILLIIRIRRS